MGTPTFVETKVNAFLVEQRKLTLDLVSNYPDKQTVAQAFSKGIVTKLPYRLIGDVVNNVNIHYDPKSWSTQFTADANALTRSIFANLTEQDFLPAYATDMIFSGDDIGLGVMDAEQLGPVTFVSSMAKAIRYALHGFPQ